MTGPKSKTCKSKYIESKEYRISDFIKALRIKVAYYP